MAFPDSTSVLQKFRSASFLLTVQLFYLQLALLAFLLTVGAFSLTFLGA